MIELNKIYCMDCVDGIGKMEDMSVDIVFTSPPYNRKRNDKYSKYNDQINDYYSFIVSVIEQCKRVCRKYIFLNIQKNYYNKMEVFKLIGHYSREIQEIFIWEKTNPMPASGFSITNAYEYFIVIGNKPLKSNTTYTKNIISTSVNNDTFEIHKAVMKMEVAEWFIEKFSNEGDVILDPFMGLGTTALVCKKLNRNYIGFEIVNDYCGIAKDRLCNPINYQSQAKINF